MLGADRNTGTFRQLLSVRDTATSLCLRSNELQVADNSRRNNDKKMRRRERGENACENSIMNESLLNNPVILIACQNLTKQYHLRFEVGEDDDSC